MSLSDCEKCWETPCVCGYSYSSPNIWSTERIKDFIKMLEKVLKERNENNYKKEE